MREGVAQYLIGAGVLFASIVGSSSPLLAGLPQTTEIEERSGRADVRLEGPVSYDPESGNYLSSGPVTLHYRELELSGGDLEYDPKDGVVELGHSLRGKFRDIEWNGGRLRFHLASHHWMASDTTATVPPSFFKRGVISPLFLSSRKLEGGTGHINAQGGRVTSCVLDDPHWGLRGEVGIVPADKVIIRNARFRLFGKSILPIPRFSISLRKRRRSLPIIPEMGQNSVDGYFLKTSYPMLATEALSATARLDYFQKRGPGLGIESDYDAGNVSGQIFSYWLNDRERGAEIDLRFQHRQRIRRSLSADVSWESRRNSGFFSQGFSTRLGQFSINHQTSTTKNWLSLREQVFSGFGRTKNLYGVLHHSFRAGKVRGQFTSNFRRFDRGSIGGSADRELSQRAEIALDGDVMDLLLRYEARIDVDKEEYAADQFYFALDRNPELLMTTSSRKSNLHLLGHLPWDLAVGIGRFREQPNANYLTRYDIRAEVPPYRLALGSHAGLTLGGRFEQFVYSDDTAQYIYSLRGNLNFGRVRSGSDGAPASELTTGFSYFVQRPFGFTPLAIDALSSYQSLDYRLQFQPVPAFRASVSTGIDLHRSIFRDVIIGTQIKPSGGTSLAINTGYDLERGEWRDLLVRWGMASPKNLLRGDFIPSFYSYGGYASSYYPQTAVEAPPPGGYRLTVTTRFSPRSGKYARVRAFFDWRLHRHWRIEALVGWNGFTNRYDFTQVRLTRDLHCWQTSLSYNSQRRELRIDFSLKAFPFLRQLFGRTDQGFLADTSVGGGIY